MPTVHQLRWLVPALLAGALAVAGCSANNNSHTSSTPASAASSGGTTTSSGGITCASGTLTSSGSTAQVNAISLFTKNYQQACPNASINYGGGGSGAGVAQFVAGSVDFAGSDFPLSAAQKPDANTRCGSGNTAIDLPMVAGAIAVGYNLPGVTKLNLPASVVAKIFSGKLTKWDDPSITQANPGAKLPSLAIQNFHRSDGSGTTFNFTNYLQNDAPTDWTYGHDKTWPAPGGQGAKGTASVVQGVKSTPGGIGYMELSYATQSNIPFASIGNAANQIVDLTTTNAVNFLAKATIAGAGGDLKLTFPYQASGATAYPAMLVTYEIVCKTGNSAKALPLLKGFLGYTASKAAQALLPANGYVSLPPNLQHQVASAVTSLS